MSNKFNSIGEIKLFLSITLNFSTCVHKCQINIFYVKIVFENNKLYILDVSNQYTTSFVILNYIKIVK